MVETTTGLRAVLSRPWVYNLAQTVMGSQRARRLEAERYIRARPGDRVLDIGCGTAEIIGYLPEVYYTGYDTSAAYLRLASARWPQHSFMLGVLLLWPDQDYDLVLALGVLHHLDDDECRDFFAVARAALKPGGRIVTVDPVITPWQNPMARLFMALDRGRNIRSREGYRELAGEGARLTIDRGLLPWWVPYTHCIVEVER